MTTPIRQLKALIERAWRDADTLCDANPGASQRFCEAQSAARQGERQHRRMCGGPLRYRGSIDLAGMYFATRFFLEGCADDPVKVLEMRADKREAYVAAFKCPVEAIKALREKHADFMALDYVQEFPK